MGEENGEREKEAEEWKKGGYCAIGWSETNFCKCKTLEQVITTMKNKKMDTRYARQVWNFVHEMAEGDWVFAYCGKNTIAYIGQVIGICHYKRECDRSHRRRVDWKDSPMYFDRYDLPNFYAKQFGKHSLKVGEIVPDSKGIDSFIRIVKLCANSGKNLPGINEDTIKAGLLKYLNISLDRLEKGLTIKSVEASIGKDKNLRPDFIAEDKDNRTMLIECKGSANEEAIEQILNYSKEYSLSKNPRLMVVAFRINEACRTAARKAGNVELIECNLSFERLK